MLGRLGSLSLLLALSLALSGCYHAIIETGAPGSGQVIEDPWANAFIYGLVPPDPVDVTGDCPAGVARVETQLSFLNGLVGAITWGIYTPMTLTVECAEGMSALRNAPDAEVRVLPAGSSADEVNRAVREAAGDVARGAGAIVVDFSRAE